MMKMKMMKMMKAYIRRQVESKYNPDVYSIIEVNPQKITVDIQVNINHHV